MKSGKRIVLVLILIALLVGMLPVQAYTATLQAWTLPPGVTVPGEPPNMKHYGYLQNYGTVTQVATGNTSCRRDDDHYIVLSKLVIPGNPERIIYEIHTPNSSSTEGADADGDGHGSTNNGGVSGGCSISKDGVQIAASSSVYYTYYYNDRGKLVYQYKRQGMIVFEPIENGTYVFSGWTGCERDSSSLSYTLQVGWCNAPPVVSMSQPDGTWATSKVSAIQMSDSNGDTVQYSLDGSAWQSYTGPFNYSFTTNGVHTISARDPSGETATTQITVSGIDRTPPVITETNLAITGSVLRSVTSNKQLQPSATATDTESGVISFEYQLVPSGGAAGAWIRWNVGTTAPLIATSFRGAVRFRAFDKVGNVSNVVTYSQDILLENIPPTASYALSITSPTNQDITLRVSATDGAEGSGIYTIRIDSAITYGAQAVATISKNGNYPVQILDQAGNAYDFTVHVTNIDKSGIFPKVEFAYNKAWTIADVPITITATDDISGIASLTMPNGSTITNPGNGKHISIPWTATANGNYQFDAIDAVGNTNSFTLSITNIDRAPPLIEQIELFRTSDELRRSRSTVFNKQVEINIKSLDSQSGVELIEYKAVPAGTPPEDLVWKQYSASSKPRIAQEWKGYIVARCTDAVGNVSPDVEYTDIITDGTAPTGNYSITPSGWTNGNVTVSLTSKDDGAGMRSITTPTGVINNGSTLDYEVLTNGNYTFTLTDEAELSSTLTVPISNIDKTAPELTEIQIKEHPPSDILTKIREAIFGKHVEVSLAAMDSQSGLDRIEYQPVNAGEKILADGWRVWSTGATLKEDLKGDLCARAIDKVGNVSAVVRKQAIVDGTAPIATHRVSPEVWTNSDVVLTISAKDKTTGVKSITAPDGKVIIGDTANFTVTGNGEYSFTLEDNADNVSVYTATVYNIEWLTPTPPKTEVSEEAPPATPDEIPPGLYTQESREFDWQNTATKIEVKSLAQSGIKEYYYREVNSNSSLPRGRSTDIGWKKTMGEISIQEEGISRIEVKSISNAGNISDISQYKIKNDYTRPTATSFVNYKGEITLSTQDQLAGIECVACSHRTHKGATSVKCTSNKATHRYDITDKAGNTTTVFVELSPGNSSGGNGNNNLPENNPLPDNGSSSTPDQEDSSSNSANSDSESSTSSTSSTSSDFENTEIQDDKFSDDSESNSNSNSQQVDNGTYKDYLENNFNRSDGNEGQLSLTTGLLPFDNQESNKVETSGGSHGTNTAINRTELNTQKGGTEANEAIDESNASKNGSLDYLIGLKKSVEPISFSTTLESSSEVDSSLQSAQSVASIRCRYVIGGLVLATLFIWILIIFIKRKKEKAKEEEEEAE